MKVIKTYDEFNPRRYSAPWIAKVNAEGKIDFSVRIGGYTGDSRKGEAGQLYVTDPKRIQYMLLVKRITEVITAGMNTFSSKMASLSQFQKQNLSTLLIK